METGPFQNVILFQIYSLDFGIIISHFNVHFTEHFNMVFGQDGANFNYFG